jgi:hypothetical protein
VSCCSTVAASASVAVDRVARFRAARAASSIASAIECRRLEEAVTDRLRYEGTDVGGEQPADTGTPSSARRAS